MQILVNGTKKNVKGKFVVNHRCTIYLAHTVNLENYW